eukprot:m.6462 g.6462  ORF g.6462 m.6462 type:complete len:1025 (+) comp2653_c0_seq1:160-3234(+)
MGSREDLLGQDEPVQLESVTVTRVPELAAFDDDSDDDLLYVARSGSSAGAGGGQRNPFSNLGDIAKQETNYVTESDNLALFQAEMHSRPKVSRVLQRLAHSATANLDTPPEDISAEKAMIALKRKSREKLGTLSGVYFPTIQNILGVIFFLRFTWIVGIAGIGESFLIVLVCCTTTMLTAISMSAIATNGVVPAGGSYFMISRSLGPEFGGAVGVLFYLGTTFASAMYILGAIELLLTYMAPGLALFPDDEGHSKTNMFNNLRVYGSALLAMLSFVTWVGVKYVNRFASLCLLLVLVSILCIFIGFFASPTGRQPHICSVDDVLVRSSFAGNCSLPNPKLSEWFTSNSTAKSFVGIPGLNSGVVVDNTGATYLQLGEAAIGVQANEAQIGSDISTSFTLLLAIFFPSVTGIMAGSNRSGDLKDPSNSIPKGTIAAIATTSLMYLLGVIFVGSVAEGALLRDKFGDSIGGKLLMGEIAWPHPWVILLGAFFSCIGAALQTLVGAPRLLQAIANDDLVPFLGPFAKGNAAGEPTRALILTAIIAEVGVLIASLDAVAPIITMFFLMCYGFVNLACSLQSLLRAPSWRPRFHYYHWGLSALGLLLCLALMFISSWLYAILAITLAVCAYYYIEWRGAAKEWGDGIRGLSMQAARFSLLRLEESPPHTKNWRPQVLALCKLNSETYNIVEPELFRTASWLKHGKGLIMVASALEGSVSDMKAQATVGQTALKAALNAHKVQGFAQVLVGKSVADTMSSLIQGAGLGALRHNTVLMGWPSSHATKNSQELFVHTLRVIDELQLAVVVPKINEDIAPETRLEGTIDVWWVVHDGGMLILLAFLLQQDPTWRRCKLRIFTVAESDDDTIQMQRDLTLFLYQLRIDAEVSVVEMLDTDISAYTYERTLQLQKRQTAMAEAKAKRSKYSGARVADDIVENNHSAASSKTSATGEMDEVDLRMMNTSVKLNDMVKERSGSAKMVFINLPGVPQAGKTKSETAISYIHFLEALTAGLPSTMLIRGGGREVITIYS